MYLQLLVIVCVILFFGYTRFKARYSYWTEKGVKGPKPQPFIGNFITVLSRKDSIASYMRKLYYQYAEEKLIGVYEGHKPTLIVKDPDLIKNVLIRDFASFTDRGLKTTNDPLARNLFVEDGQHWKMLRQKLTPIFTTGKLKKMIPLLDDCVKEYLSYVDKLVDQNTPQEIRSVNMKYTLKAITSVAFGLDIDTFTETDSKFVLMANKIFEPSIKRIIIPIVLSYLPDFVRKLNIRLSRQDVVDFFLQLVGVIIKEREGKPKTRKDFMDLMIELKEQGFITVNREKDGLVADELEICDEIIAAQAVLFYAAGFETSSGAMSNLLYELALNPEIQERCFDEIKNIKTKYGGHLSYEALGDLQYLNLAFDEALRKHPVAGVLIRKAVAAYKFEGTDVTIEKGVNIRIPVAALQSDPKYYLDPERFDPDRFAPANRGTLRDGTYLPFGDGPRNCIGMRFAKVQSLMGVAHFLDRFRVSPSEKTVPKIRHDPRALVLVSIDGIWLTITRR